MKEARCPNPKCDGIDSGYMVDDCTPHECDKCGTTWKTYNPQKRIKNAFDIKLTQ